MSRNLKNIALLILFPIIIPAQSFNIDWQSCFGGSEWDYANDILAVDGGYLIAGVSASSDGDISFSHGVGDGWLIKVSNTGELLWEKTFGGSSSENFYRIFPASQNTYFIIASSSSSDGDISNDPYPDSGDLWLLKIDAEGNIIWEEIFGGTGWEQIPTGVTTSDGGLVALVWSSSGDGDVSNHFGLWDAWMIKVNSDGEKQWDFTLGSPGQDVGQAIIQTSDGGFLVGVSAQLFEGGNITCTPHNDEYSEAIIVKLDANLNIEWDRCYGGSQSEAVTDLKELNDGYLIGANSFSNDGDVSGNHGNSDIWIIKVDFDGNVIWQKCLGGSDYEDVRKTFINEFEEILIIGNTFSFDGDVSGNHSISGDYSDIWIVNIDSDGDLLWQQCFGGIADEEIHFGFHHISENNFVIAGYTNNGPSYDVGCTPYGGNGDRDFWVFEVKDTTVSLQEQPAQVSALTTYPNPAKDYVCFERKGKESSCRMEIGIYSASGLSVRELTLYPGETLKVWDTRSIPAGIYFYRSLRQDGTAEYGKVVVE